MTCPDCGSDYYGKRCKCGFSTESTKPNKQPYYYKDCATPGCTVVIGARLGTAIEPAICKWCQNHTAVYRRQPKEVV